MNHILLIEDDPAVAQSLSAGLERDHFQVSWRETGTEGMAFAGTQHPHLILLDLRLPDGSGIDFCRQMRQAGIRQPILILTAQHDEMDKVLGLEMGADDYVTKPFSLRELISRIRAQLRRAYGELANGETGQLFAGDLSIDLARGQASKAGKQLVLTPLEFKLLTYLVQHKNQALSRAQIIDAVWGFSPDLDSEKTVNVHIRHLRKKIEADPDHPELVITVPGIGYRMAV